MTLPNSSQLQKTFILVVGLLLCLVPNAFAGNGGGPFNLMIGKTLAGSGTGFAEGVPAQNVAITPYGIATDAMGNVYVGNGNTVLKIDARMRTISTVAGAPGGSASSGYADGAASSAMFSGITALSTDAAGNVYIADAGNNAIRMLNVEANTVCTIAANSASGATWCFGQILSTMNHPVAIAVPAAGNLGYIADQSSNIYRIDSAFTQVAGTGSAGYGGDGGPASAAQLNHPLGLVLDSSGNLLIADSGNNLIREITTSNTMTLVAGLVSGGVPQSGYSGDNGNPIGAALSNPTGIALSTNGSGQQLIFVDTGNNVIRSIENNQISTVAPLTGLTIYGLASITNGGIGVDTVHNRVLEVGSFLDSGASYVSTASGAPNPTSTTFTASLTIQQAMTITSIAIPSAYSGAGFTVGAITGCTIDGTTTNPSGATCSITIKFKPTRPGIRRAPLLISYNSGQGSQMQSWGITGYGLSPSLGVPIGMAQFADFSSYVGGTTTGTSLTGATYDTANNFYVTTGGNHTVWNFNSNTMAYTLVAGQSGVSGSNGDGGLATSAQLNNPSGITEDPAGNLYIADTSNCRIRAIGVNGIISTVVGNGTCTSTGDGGTAGAATTAYPKAIYADALGNIFFAEDARVRVFNLNGNNIISTYAGGGSSTNDGIPATQASLAGITSITMDRYGNLYMVLGTAGGNKVREVDSHGYITTVPTGTIGSPAGIAVDQAGVLYISDTSNNEVLRVDLNKNALVLAGRPGMLGLGCSTGSVATSATLGPVGPVVTDSRGNVLYLNTNSSTSYVCQVTLGVSGNRNYTFRNTATGTSNNYQTEAYNNGNLSMTLSGISVTGTPSTAFSEIAASSPDCANVSSLSVGSSCNLNLKFTAPPAQTSAYTGTLTFTDGAFDSPQSIGLSGTSIGVPSQLLLQGVPTSIVAGSSLAAVIVSIEDVDNFLEVSSYPVTINLYGPAPSGGGIGPLVVSPTFTVTNGTMMIPAIPATGINTAGSYTLQATCASCGGGLTSASVTFSVTANTTSGIHFQVQAPTTATAGQQFQFTVTAMDNFGNALSSYPNTVQFTSSDASAVLPAVSGLPNGTYQFSATLNTSGPQTITVTDVTNPSVSGTSAAISVSGGASTMLVTLNAPSTITAGVVPLAASVTNNAVPVTVGSVTFSYGLLPVGQTSCSLPLQSLGRAQLVSSGALFTHGTANLYLGFPPGTYCLSATFNGTATLASATSPQQTMTVTGYGDSDVTAGATADGNNYDFNATVYGYGRLAPTGSVQLVDVTNTPQTYLGGPVQLPIPTTPIPHAFLSNGGATVPNGIGSTVSAAAADFNNSGNLGGVVTNYSASTITVILPSQHGQPTQTAYVVGGNPLAVAVADFNGDGALDIAVAVTNTGNGDIIRILLNDGQGNFTLSPNTYVSGAFPVAMLAADFNKDGYADLAIIDKGSTSGGGEVTILLGNGDGTFKSPPATFAVGNSPVALTSGDFNNDGNIDLAVANNGDASVSILPGKGDGTFQTQVVTNLTGTPQLSAIASGDFNGDAQRDLALADGQGNVIILLGKGDGTFQTQTTFAAGTAPSAIATADFNADGPLDLVVANSGSNNVSLLLGNGNGTFQTQQTYPTGNTPSALILGFFDKSLLPEVVVFHSGDSTLVPLSNVTVSTMPQQLNIPIYGIAVTPHAVQVNYLPDPGSIYGGSSATISNLTASVAPSTINLNFPYSNPVVYGTDLWLTISVNPINGIVPTGTFSYQVDGSKNSAPLQNGASTVHLGTGFSGGYPNSLSGTHAVSVTYSGDSNYQMQSTPQVQTINVSSVQPPSSNLGANFTSIYSTGSTTLTATVTGVPTSGVSNGGTTVAQAPTGTVTFSNGAYTSAPVALAVPSSGAMSQATLTLGLGPGLAIGNNTFSATYSGDGNYSSIAIAGTPMVTVISGAAPGVVVTLTVPSTATSGAVPLVASVTNNNVPVALGSVTFSYAPLAGGQTSCPSSLQSVERVRLVSSNALGFTPGGATLNLRFPPGKYCVSATFNGTASLVSAASSPQIMTVTGTGNSAATVGATPDGNNYDFTATVYGFGRQAPTGSVQLTDTTTTPAANVGSPVQLSVPSTPVPHTFISRNSNNPLTIANGVGSTVSAAAADFNNSGQPGGVVTNYTAQTITVIVPDANGNPKPKTYSVGGNPLSVAVADFNGDGALDIAVGVTNTGSGDLVQVWLNDGNGNFTQSSSTYASGAGPVAMVVADFNKDGYPDLAIVNNGGAAVTILLGNGDGTFQTAPAPASYPVGNSPVAIALGDFNNDGDVDLAVANNADSSVSVLLGNGDGTFQQQQVTSVAGITQGTGMITSGGSFAQPNFRRITAALNGIVAGDFNGDGKRDIALANGQGNVIVLLGNGDGTFQAQSNYSVGTAPAAIAAADFNADGALDLVVANSGSNNAGVLLGNGDGTFQAQQTYPTGTTPEVLVVGLYDNSLLPDITVFNGDKTVTSLANVTYSTATINNSQVLGTGTHTIQANYQGDSIYGGVTASTPVTAYLTLLTLSSTALDFGNTGIGTSKPSLQSVSNFTAAPVTVYAISTGSPFFPISADSCSGTTLAVNKSCNFTVSFAPTATGTQGGTLTVSSALATNPSATLSGKGLATALTLSSTALDFGNTGAGTSKASLQSVSNFTAAPVTVTAISTGSPFFPISADSCSGTTLAVNKSCNFTVSFAPTATGTQGGTLTVSSALATNPSATLSGKGLATALTLSSTALDFGNTGAGTSKASLQSVSNFTAAPITVTAISTASPFFPISADSCSGTTLAVNKSCNFTVSFAPTATGTQGGTLTVSSALATNPSATLSGKGLATALTLSSTALDFGNTGAGTSKASLQSVSNFTAAPVTVTAISTGSPFFPISADSCSGTTLAVNKSCNFTVSFAPTVTGTQGGTLTVSSALATNPSATLSGKGLATALTLSSTALDFGNTGAGTSKASVQSVFNFTAAPVTITAISTGSPFFPISADSCSGTTLAVNKSCNFTVSFAPTATGTQGGTLTVSSALATNPSATLSGKGLATALTLSSTTLSFGGVTTGTSKASLQSVFNFTAAPITVTAISTGSPFFPISADSCTGTTLAVNKSCNFTVSFAPTATGTQGGTLTVSSALATNPSATLSGKGL